MYKKIIVPFVLSIALVAGFLAPVAARAEASTLWGVAHEQLGAEASAASIMSLTKFLAKKFNIAIPEWGISGTVSHNKIPKTLLQAISSSGSNPAQSLTAGIIFPTPTPVPPTPTPVPSTFPITIQSNLLNTKWAAATDGTWADAGTSRTYNLAPGTYTMTRFSPYPLSSSAANLNFTVDSSGNVSNPDLSSWNAVWDPSTHTLNVNGWTVTVQSNLTDTRWGVNLFDDNNWQPIGSSETYSMETGDYTTSIETPFTNPYASFSVDANGLVQNASSVTGTVAGNGTATLALNPSAPTPTTFPITFVDYPWTSGNYLYQLPADQLLFPFSSAVSQTDSLAPGEYYYFNQQGGPYGNIYFSVDGSGIISCSTYNVPSQYNPTGTLGTCPNGQFPNYLGQPVTGAGTSTLTIGTAPAPADTVAPVINNTGPVTCTSNPPVVVGAAILAIAGGNGCPTTTVTTNFVNFQGTITDDVALGSFNISVTTPSNPTPTTIFSTTFPSDLGNVLSYPFQQPYNQFTTAGTYVFTETAVDAAGNTKTLVKNVVYSPAPPTILGFNNTVKDASGNVIPGTCQNGALTRAGSNVASVVASVSGSGNVITCNYGTTSSASINISGNVTDTAGHYITHAQIDSVAPGGSAVRQWTYDFTPAPSAAILASAGPNATYNFNYNLTSAGIYYFNETATDSAGATVNVQKIINYVPTNLPPVVSQVTPTQVNANTSNTYTFSVDFKTGDIGSGSCSVNWGDGSPSSVPVIFAGSNQASAILAVLAGSIGTGQSTHVYTTAGTYNVNVSCTNAYGTGQSNTLVTVIQPITKVYSPADGSTINSGTVISATSNTNLSSAVATVSSDPYVSVVEHKADGTSAFKGSAKASQISLAFGQGSSGPCNGSGGSNVLCFNMANPSSLAASAALAYFSGIGQFDTNIAVAGVNQTYNFPYITNSLNTNPQCSVDWGDGQSSSAVMTPVNNPAAAFLAAAGLTYNGSASHTYASAGGYNATISCVDSNLGTTETAMHPISVSAPASSCTEIPMSTNASLVTPGTVGVPYFTGNNLAPGFYGNSPITGYSISAGRLPNGMSIAPINGTGGFDLTGTPTEAGIFSFTFRIEQSADQAASALLARATSCNGYNFSYTLTVLAGGPPTLTLNVGGVTTTYTSAVHLTFDPNGAFSVSNDGSVQPGFFTKVEANWDGTSHTATDSSSLPSLSGLFGNTMTLGGKILSDGTDYTKTLSPDALTETFAPLGNNWACGAVNVSNIVTASGGNNVLSRNGANNTASAILANLPGGGGTTSQTFTASYVNADTVAPTVTVNTLPQFTNHQITISGNVTDGCKTSMLTVSSAEQGISNVEVPVNADGSFTFAPNFTANGTYHYTFTAYDVAGNTTSAVISTLYDTVAPVTTAVQNDPDADTFTNSVTLNSVDPGTLGVNASGVASLTYSINGGAPVTVSASSVNIDLTPFRFAPVTIVFGAVDNATNAEVNQTLTIAAPDVCPTAAGKYQGCPAQGQVSVEEVDGMGKGPALQTDAALETKVFSEAAGSCAATIGTDPKNWDKIYNTCAYENIGKETISPNDPATNKPRNLISDLAGLGMGTGDKVVLVKSLQNPDKTYSYMGFELKGVKASDNLSVGFNITPGQTAKGVFVQNSQFSRNSAGYWSGSNRAQVIQGSELDVYVPDYVAWTDGQQIYPFTFISDSDWNVDVCLQVPAGYTIVAPGTCDQTLISNEARVVEFQVATGAPASAAALLAQAAPVVEPNFTMTLHTIHQEAPVGGGGGQVVETDHSIPVAGISSAAKAAADAAIAPVVSQLAAQTQSAQQAQLASAVTVVKPAEKVAALAVATSTKLAQATGATPAASGALAKGDIKGLQAYLNAHGFTVSASGAGSKGYETNVFGPKTRAALKAFQEAHAAEILAHLNLVHGTGVFGESTRAYINAHQ